LRSEALGRFMIITACIAIAASVAGGVAGVVLVRELDATLGQSLELTSDALTAVDDSLQVAADTLALVDDGVSNTRIAGADVVEALDTGAGLLRETADVTENDLAPGVTAVEDALPGLVAVAETVDGTLAALSRLPVGVDYDPENGLDDALRGIQLNLAGTGAELQELAGLVREAGVELDTVQTGAQAVVEDLGELDDGVSSARALIDDYTATADETRRLITRTRDELSVRISVATIMIIAIAVAVAVGQVALLWLGWQIVRHHERLDVVFGAGPPS
jgi:hypothetical protein